MQDKLKARWPGVLFSALIIITYAVAFNMLASYNVQSSLVEFAELTQALIVLVNMSVISALSKYPIRAFEDYGKQKKEGKSPVFKSKDIAIKEELDFWKQDEIVRQNTEKQRPFNCSRCF